MSIGDRIMQAWKILESGGWCKGFLVNGQRQHCAVGAVNEVAYGGALNRGDVEAPELQVLAQHIPTDFDFKRAERELYGPIGLGELSSWEKCVLYNNTRDNVEDIRVWFAKAALNEGISLS